MNNMMNKESTKKCCPPKKEQTHVHEVLGSVRLAELREDPHNHRFAGVTDEVIYLPCGGHIHKLHTKTDFYEDHFHEICVETEKDIPVGKGKDGRHVHFIKARTEVEDKHCHEFITTTQIENPIGD